MCDKSTVIFDKFTGESGTSIQPFSSVCNDNYRKLNNNMDAHLVNDLKHIDSNSVEPVIHVNTCATANIISSSVSYLVWPHILGHCSS